MISFGDFQLDRRTRRLRHRGGERPLRAKSSAVLLHLAEHPDRLVTHAELLRAVWPGTSVSRTVLRVCIREIRAALGSEADRFLATVPGRGYRLAVEPTDRRKGSAVLVGREAEKARLREALARARGGRRQVVLVSGVAGAGKTALLDQVLEELRADGEVRCARGQALELQDRADGCAAVLDLLSRLCDEAEGAEAVRVLSRWAPGWLLQLPARLDDAEAESLRAREAHSSWEGRLLELGEAVEHLAAEKPLVLVLEDLHWSDASTIDALAYLTRRTVAARLLVVVSYRPEALAAGHPFIAARACLEADGLCSEIELGPLPLEAVETFVARRLAPEPLADGVAQELYDYTGGHALLLVATVDQLLARHRLVVRDGAWRIEGRLSETILDRAPDTSHGRRGNRDLGPQPLVATADDTGLATERRQLTVLACELVGSTDLAQRLDPEDLRSLVRAFQESASAVIRRYDGHVAQYRVDGLLAYFSYPQAHEDDAERAVRAGLDVLTALRASNAGLEPRPAAHLEARIGIHTGEVVIGDAGGGAKHEMIAHGDVPHVAACALGAAEPDSVVITPATARLVAGMFATEERAPQSLEGLREPLVLRRVMGSSGARGRLAVAAAAGRLTPFVGREPEIATLAEHWNRARRGMGRSILVLGEAGVGKSRLAARLRERVATTPHVWMESGATPYTTGTPFHPVIALVTSVLGFEAEESAEGKRSKIERGLGALATPEAVALIADLVGLRPPLRVQLSSELQRRRTIDLLAQWMLSIGAAQPTVLLLEDLHWCDPSTLELLGHLMARSHTPEAPTVPAADGQTTSAAKPGPRILVLLTARPEFSPPWPTGAHATTLELGRLSERETRDMVRALIDEALPASSLESETLDAIVARSDGVPLYVEELTKSVVEPGTARSADAIPTTLADSLMGRLDRLATAKEVAQRAAVLGREFTHALLAAMSDHDEASLRRELAHLVEAEIVFARGEPPDATYAFKHALIQEAAYQSLLKRTRQQLHARVGRVLEERFPARAAAEPEVVARHYDQAGLAAAAIAHYQRAGERAAQRFANEEAITHLRRALALLATLPETRERNERELAIQIALGPPLSAARGWTNPDYERVFVRARELASQIGESPELPRVLDGMSAAYLMRGDLATALEIARETMAAAEHTKAPFDVLLGHVCLGCPLLFAGSFSLAFDHFTRAIELYDPAEHAPFAHTLGFDRGVAAHSYAALCRLYLGYADEALARSDEAVALARRVEHPFSLANALFQAAVVDLTRREFGRTTERIAELEDLAGRLGFPFWLGAGKLLRGCARGELGEPGQGVGEMEEALVELAAIESGLGAPATLELFAAMLSRAGRHDDGLATLDLALAQAGMQGQHYVDAEIHRVRAEILLARSGEAAEEAEKSFRQSLELARSRAARCFELRAAMGLARLWQSQGKRAEARSLLAPVHAWFTEGLELPDLRDARALLDELA